jgi:hypothetical protein
MRYGAPFRGEIAIPVLLIAILFSAAGAMAAPHESVTHRFQSGGDGSSPRAIVAASSGDLYGATSEGGNGPCSFNGQTGCGTIYRLAAPNKPGEAWKETVLYRFQGGSDGAFPGSDLIIDRAGNLFGTTNAGGQGCSIGCGTAFELVPPAVPGDRWKKILLYTFQGGKDGFGPVDLIESDTGGLFGVTYFGGLFSNCTYGCGSVFELIPQRHGGAYRKSTLYLFKGNPGNGSGDGAAPLGIALTQAGELYGTTNWGGNCDPSGCYGTDFRLRPAGRESAVEDVLYRFSDGAHQPASKLVIGNASTFFGTGYYDVYSLTFAQGVWRESDLYDANSLFYGGVILAPSGDLYGTAAGGGKQGAGYAFRLEHDSGWSVSVLHQFQGGNDGDTPDAAPVIGKWGDLFGTTLRGGNHGCKFYGSIGCGTVFEVAPRSPGVAGTSIEGHRPAAANSRQSSPKTQEMT